VRRQTSDTAHAAGLYDRGVIAVGKKADINVIDFDRLEAHRPYVVHDLPTKGKRFLQKATGYTATIKSGAISFRNGESTGVLNGRLLRGPATVR
jgi:N-acyl-D-aspartate/D-glutamate deacylase